MIKIILEFLFKIFFPKKEYKNKEILKPSRKKVEEEVKTPVHIPRYMWCLDNGHGKLTNGKRSPRFANGKQLLEYEFNRDIVARITKALHRRGVLYYNVVPETEIGNYLSGRVERVNNLDTELPKMFVSIHANAFGQGWTDPSGIETWYKNGSYESELAAQIFQKHLIRHRLR